MGQKNYDLIAIGTGSAMNIVERHLGNNPEHRVAVIDKDQPGGICLTRGCIPSKILLYPAELVRTVQKSDEFGIDAQIENINFKRVMNRMRSHIDPTIENIERSLSESRNIHYYRKPAKFIEPYILQVGDERISSKLILLCSGSKPHLPPIKGLDGITYHTSDTVLSLEELPESLAIIGGGYIGAEYGHFFSSMGSKVTIMGRNPKFLPDEEEEISTLI